jgi:hypothetical protein
VADFPKLEPFSRRYGPGEFNAGDVPGLAGTRRRFYHPAGPMRQPLTLVYRWITQEETDSIREHYLAQHCGHEPFRLPVIIWAGQATVFNDLAWKYTGPPQEEEMKAGRHHVTVQLVAVPDVVARTTTDP